MNDCHLVASQIFLPPEQYNDIIKNKLVEYRINDTQKSSVMQLDTTSLINNASQAVKITARNGGCSLLLIGLREKNNILAFAKFYVSNKNLDELTVRICSSDGLSFVNNKGNANFVMIISY